MSDPLTEKEIFFLHYLRNRQIEWKIDEPVKRLFDNYQDVLSKLYQCNYLKIDDHSYFLEVMSIAQLKKILRNLQLPIAGKKEDLICRIVENTTADERVKICPVLYYVLTSKAIEIDEKYKQIKHDENIALKKIMLQKINNGQYIEAFMERAKIYSQQIIPPGIDIDWSDTSKIKKQATDELNKLHQYDFSDLNNTERYKELLIKALYYDNIEQNLFSSIRLLVLPDKETLKCPALDIFFQKKKIPTNEIYKVFVYLDTKRFNAFQKNMNIFLKKDSYQPLSAGDFKISDNTISLWTSEEEYKILFQKEIKGFPKTFQTYVKHKNANSEKYKNWISYL